MADSFQHLRIFPSKMNRETWAQSNVFRRQNLPILYYSVCSCFYCQLDTVSKKTKKIDETNFVFSFCGEGPFSGSHRGSNVLFLLEYATTFNRWSTVQLAVFFLLFSSLI
jgi:hypothetical protein